VSIEAQKLIARNPGFHRVIVHCRPERPVEYEHLADPAVEPSLRVLLSSIMELDPQQPDPDPYVIV
jgi:hypothetical protein